MLAFIVIFCGVVIHETARYVWRRLRDTNMTVGPSVERALSPREALAFALDNDLPINPRAVIGHNNGPPIAGWN